MSPLSKGVRPAETLVAGRRLGLALIALASPTEPDHTFGWSQRRSVAATARAPGTENSTVW